MQTGGGIEPDAGGPRVLIGERGCGLVQAANGSARNRVSLRIQNLDHRVQGRAQPRGRDINAQLLPLPGVETEIIFVAAFPLLRLHPSICPLMVTGRETVLCLSDGVVGFLLQNFRLVADSELHFVQRERCLRS